MTKIYEPDEYKVRCEVFSRVVGYIRPVNQWNEGKQEEFKERRLLDGKNTPREVSNLQTELQER